MKNKIYVLALALLTLSLSASAQFHQFGAYGQAGWASMVSGSDRMALGRGFHTGMGVNYEMQIGHFLLDAGVGFQWTSAGANVDNYSFVYPGDGSYLLDTQNEPFRMNVKINNRCDFVRHADIFIPVMVGGVFGDFFFMGGVKLYAPLYSDTRVRGFVTTEGLYDRYLQPVTSASYHGFVDNQYANLHGGRFVNSAVDIMGSFELGVNITHTNDFVSGSERTILEHRMRLSLYADYSLAPLNHNASLAPLAVDPSHVYDIDRFTASHILNTEEMLNTYLANLNVGIKFTVLFGTRQRFLCLSCESAVEAGINNPNSGYRARNNRQADTMHRPSQVNNPTGR